MQFKSTCHCLLLGLTRLKVRFRGLSDISAWPALVGEIAKMIELGIGPNAKQVNLDERLTRSVKVVAGTRGPRNVRFRGKSGPPSPLAECPLSATSRHPDESLSWSSNFLDDRWRPRAVENSLFAPIGANVE